MADKILGFLGDLVKPATGGGNYVYYSGASEDIQEYLLLARVIKFKYKQSESVNFITSGWFRGVIDDGEVMGVCFDLSLKMSSTFTGTSKLVTLEDFFSEVNTGRWTQITEEEFYSL